MTAFLKKSINLKYCNLFFELFSFNSRNIDIFLDIPDFLKSLEFFLYNKIRSKFKRGKIHFNIRIEFNSNKQNNISLNKELAKSLIDISKFMVKNGCNGKLDPVDIFSWPGVIFFKKNKIDLDFDFLLKKIDCFLFDFLIIRSNEGNFLKTIINKRLNLIKKEICEIRYLFPRILKKNFDNLKSKLYDVSYKINNNRLEQELVLLAQKLDISEELDRIDFYVLEMKKVFRHKVVSGRHLNFITQELNREANTISSKSNSIKIINSSIRLKIFIEEIREQIQNIE